ncbi:rhamnulokinase [Humibacter ginsenosidimutans]|uniref:Rhamnulokinase n=1 Tax=Humibacter ginsenosidimutans TaxID=2599293 RepID=A0A5B8MB26_9MICO|nr:rhamnulokinase family protein [Humibacter ginsenosidimutans]QDZ16902.1 rhamnulokinase [Humibacter ginsenosidimutans]
MLGRAYSGDDSGENPPVLELDEIARFANEPVRRADGLHWNVAALREAVLDGLADAAASAARRGERIASIGIDAWAVDYGLLRHGELVAGPRHYRDARHEAGVDAVHRLVPFPELYARNGLQFLPFNTLYQFAADPDLREYAASGIEHDGDDLDAHRSDVSDGDHRGGDGIVLVPDLFAYWLTGVRVAEETNASTTGLVPAGEPEPRWDAELAERVGVPAGILPPIVRPGSLIGTLTPEIATRLDLPESTPVVAVGSHDTASAVVATPFAVPGSAFVSCGTWGLVGVESPRPVLTAEARDAGFTNERGVDGTTRLLHNVMGLWVLNECVRAWGEVTDLPTLLTAAARVDTRFTVFDIDDPRLMPQGDMPARVAQLCAEAGGAVPATHTEFVRSIVESLAEAFARAAARASTLTGVPLGTINLVGGGARNALLCQATADRAGVPVVAGPVEATALGNVLVQARTAGAIGGILGDLRRLVIATQPTTRYEPR